MKDRHLYLMKPSGHIPIAAFTLILLLAASALGAQEQTTTKENVSRDDLDAIRHEIRELRAGQRAVRHDLDQLNAALRELIQALKNTEIQRGDQASPDILLSVDGKPYLGKVDAPVTVFELSDFE